MDFASRRVQAVRFSSQRRLTQRLTTHDGVLSRVPLMTCGIFEGQLADPGIRTVLTIPVRQALELAFRHNIINIGF